VPVKTTSTAWLYQVPWSGPRSGAPLTLVGAEASRLIVTEFELVPPALVAEHVNVVPEVSVLIVVLSHPVFDVIVDSLSTTVQLTVTLLVYQPLLPSVPVIVGVITGGVESGKT
jgi:hypothetical protein